MKQLLALAVTFAFVSATHADPTPAPEQKTYAGEGTWKKSDGTSGTHEAEAVISKDPSMPNVINMECTVRIATPEGTQEMVSNTTLTKQDNGFVMIEGENGVTGTGTCFDKGSPQNRHKSCQLSMRGEGFSADETWIFKGTKIHRMGMMTEGEHQIGWQDELTLQ